MRAFVGIDFSREVKDEIYELQNRLKKYAIKGRWKHSDNLHLTLKFLDEISQTQKEKLDEAMENLCHNNKPFNLGFKGLGIFEGRESIRVLWLGLVGDIQSLESIHTEIDKALLPIGFLAEKRKFKPHITLGQDILFKSSFNQIKETVGEVEFGNIDINSLFLFKSEQIQNKRIYSKVSEYLLF
jgi:RNA 2',3'-cyclic 3'-phosphodiesterase